MNCRRICEMSRGGLVAEREKPVLRQVTVMLIKTEWDSSEFGRIN